MQQDHIQKFQFEELGASSSKEEEAQPMLLAEIVGTPANEESQEVLIAKQEADRLQKELDEKLKEAEAKGYKEGHAKGHEEGYTKGQEEGNLANVAVQEKIDVVLQQINTQFVSIVNAQKESLALLEQDTVLLAEKIARKVAGDAFKDNPTTSITALIQKYLPALVGENEIIITVNDAFLDSINEKVRKLAEDANVKLIVKGDSSISESDCRIAWGNGEIARNTSELWKEIEALYQANNINIHKPDDAITKDT